MTDYGFDRSDDGGTNWTLTTWLGSTALSASSSSVPSLVCANSGGSSNGKGCQYRVRAFNNLGASAPSNVVKTWTVPSAPRTLSGSQTDATFSSIALAWLAPTTTGSFASLIYTAQRSDDGGAFTAVTPTTNTLGVTVACVGARSCAFRVTAANGQGTSIASNTVTIVTAPGRPQSLNVLTTSTDLGTGVSQLAVSWRPPTTGMAATSYRYSVCRLPAGTTTGCADSSTSWSASATLGAQPDLNTRVETCSAGTASCYLRVAAVNSRAGASAWRTVNLAPWAPFNVGVTPGPAAGQVTITFGGPAESGPNGAAKYYTAFVCTADCGNNASWTDTALTIPYPPTGSSPFSAGTYACGGNASCQVRMQFTAGNGAKGPVTPVATARGLLLSVVNPPDGTTTNDATPPVDGLCTIGAGTVTAVVLPGPVTLTSACSVAGTWSSTVPGGSALADGTYTVQATQAGTVGPSVSNTNTFTIDTTAPVVTITTPVNGAALNSSNTTIGGACETGASSVTIGLLGPSPATLTAPCVVGAWSTSTALPDGTYVGVAGQSDAVGNTGTSATVTFTIDTVAPLVTIANPTANQYFQTHTPTASGTCETPSGTVALTMTNTVTNVVTTTTAPCLAAAWTTAMPILADGGYTISASQTDTAGNTGSSSNVPFTIDTTAPVVTLGAPANNAFITTPTTTFSGTCTSGDSAVTVAIVGPPTATLSTPCVAGTWSVSTSEPDGTYSVFAAQTDAAGNTGASAAHAFTVDTNAPAVSITNPSNGAVLNTHTPTISGLCSSGDGLVTVTITGAGAPAPFGTTCTAPGNWTTAAPSLPDGVHTVTATQTDAAANTGTSATISFTIDTAAPVVTVTNPLANALRNTTTNTFDGVCETGSGLVTVTVTNLASSAITTLTPACTSGAWSTSTPLTDASYTVAAAQTDAATNTGTSATINFRVDTVAPVVSVTNPSAGAARNTSANSFGGACTTGDGAVAITLTNTATSAVTNLTSTCTGGAWSASNTLADGSYTVKAAQTDAAANTGTSATISFTVDTVAPVVTVTNPTASAIRTTTSNSFGGACETASGTVTVTVTNTATSTVTTLTTSCTGGSWTASTNLADSTYTVKATQTDAAANTGTSSTVNFRVDSTPPTVTISYPVNNAKYNAAQWTNRPGHCTTGNICGTASDSGGSGVSVVKVTIQRSSDNKYWNGSAWQTTSIQVTATGTSNWSTTLTTADLTDGVTYTAGVQATDAGGLQNTPATVHFTYDTARPSVSSFTSSNNNWSLEVGDKFVVNFNDSIDPLSVASTATLTLHNTGGDCNNVVTSYRISGLAAGEASTGSCGYIKGTGNSLNTITWDGTLAVSGSQVIFTVTSACIETGCASALMSTTPAAARQGALSFTPVSTIADVAGNLVVVSTSTYCHNGASPCGAVF